MHYAIVLKKVTSIATDSPGALLFQSMRCIFPNLKLLVLDPVHLVIVYQQSHGGRRTAGQTMLRRLQNKLNSVDRSKPANYWGHAYDGSVSTTHPRYVESMRRNIMSGGLPLYRAKAVFDNLDDDKPWYSTMEYVEVCVGG